jgi:hypothetical protein
MADSFSIIVHGFNEAIVDSEVKVSKDSLFMSSEHPSEISQGFDSAVSSPPEPAFQILGCPSSTLVVPEFSEQLFEQVSFDNSQIHLEQLCQRKLLLVCEVPRVLQPDVACTFEDFVVYLGQGFGFHFSDLIDCLHQMTNDMKLVEDNYCFAAILLDDIDIVLPHIAAHTFNGGSALCAPPLKESTQRIFVPMGASPDESFLFQIVNLSMVDMAFLSANLIDAYQPDIPVVFPLPAVSDSCIHRASDCVPRDIEKHGHLIPREQSGPEGKHGDEGETDGLFAHAPGNTFHLDSVFRTSDSPGMVVEKDSDTPKGDVSPTPFSELILSMRPLAADAAGQLPSSLDIQLDPQLVVDETGRNNTMVLDSESETYDTGYEHESSLRYLGFGYHLLNNGFDSCFLVLMARS